MARVFPEAALDSVLDMLGESSKRALLFHLKEECGVSLYDNQVSLKQIHWGLCYILGAGGADVIMECVLIEMDRIAANACRRR